MSARRPKRKPPSFTFRLHLSKALRELESAVREAQDRSWQEIDRQHGSEIAHTLAKAYRVEDLKEAATLAQSLGCLLRLSREQILPMEAAFKEKISEIMSFLRAEADRLLTGTD